MTKPTKDDELYREMCRVVGKVVLEMRDLGQEPKYIVIAGVLRTALANQRIQRSALEKQAMETVINALARVIAAIRVAITTSPLNCRDCHHGGRVTRR